MALTIPLETLADGLLVAPQPRPWRGTFGESMIEGREAGHAGHQEFRRMRRPVPRPCPCRCPCNLSSNTISGAVSLPLPSPRIGRLPTWCCPYRRGALRYAEERLSAALSPSQNASVVSAG